jgi:hypothetical protein
MASERETGTTRARYPSTESSTNENSQNVNGNIEEQERIEYNPRWMGYLCIIMFSGINYISISNVPRKLRHSVWASSMPFGVLTFLIASLVLIHDRCRKKPCGFDYTKSKSGFVEGFTLLFSVVWWIVGVAYITRPGGIAYTVSNIYYSAWLTVFACVYTLNEWSDSKDILSIAEITSVSFTLRYWWIHFTAAFVVFVSSCSLVRRTIGIHFAWNRSFWLRAHNFFRRVSRHCMVGLLKSLALNFFRIFAHFFLVGGTIGRHDNQ